MRKSIFGLSLAILFLFVGLVFAQGVALQPIGSGDIVKVESKKPNVHKIESIVLRTMSGEAVETDQTTVFDVVRTIVFWFSPIIFFVGVLMVLSGNYRKLEEKLSREMGMRKKVLPKFEANDYSFHEWLLKKDTLLGLICIACASFFFFTFK